ncbi:hypothetical protein TA3x_004336 [Tundrisphaera sp. TA3]
MPPDNRWSIKDWMIAVASIAIIFYTAVEFYKGYVWMVKAGW